MNVYVSPHTYNRFVVQWNTVLWPPWLYGHLIITGTLFWPEWKLSQLVSYLKNPFNTASLLVWLPY